MVVAGRNISIEALVNEGLRDAIKVIVTFVEGELQASVQLSNRDNS